jgi:alpha-methylacyl-CoA racemase
MQHAFVRSGPLTGLKVVEFEAIGPVPLAAMVLADMGADVVRICREKASRNDVTARGRRFVTLDLKSESGHAAAIRLLHQADVLLEGYRPGVMERLGLGPEVLHDINARLIYGRMTGWGQTGPMAHSAGHDINYLSITGALGAIRAPEGKPIPPLNIAADYGGGSMFLVAGVLAALIEARSSGLGQIVDCAMVEGVLNMLSMFHGMMADGQWDAQAPRTNFLDGGAPFYDTYECSCGGYVAVGCLEQKFFGRMCLLLGMEDLAAFQADRARWPELRARLEQAFRSRTAAEWTELFEGDDACVSGVISMAEAAHHPHLVARGAFTARDGLWQATPAPRFSRTPSVAGRMNGTSVSAAEVEQSWSTRTV